MKEISQFITAVLIICLCLLAEKSNAQTTNTFPASGNVGIGTSNPIVPFEIVSSSSDTGLRIRTAGINTDIRLHIAGGEYGYLSLGGDTRLRGNGMHSSFGGKVGIGVTNPTAKLAVNGDIKAKEVIVTEQSADWPDYVFKEGYDLPNLKELEQFIKEHKHLPGIPTGEEIEQKGQNLGTIQAKLLQKIEELTLRIIEHEKKIQVLLLEMKSLKTK